MTGLTRRRLWILVTAAFVIGAIEFLPAYQFEAGINRALPTPWNMALSGTIWDGFGVLRSGHAPDALAVPLTWKFDPMALARLRIAWKVVPTSPSLSGSVRIGADWQSVEVRDAALTIDAAALQQAIPVLALFAPSGTLLFSTPGDAQLTIGYGSEFHVTGVAHVKADNFGLRPYGAQPLGNYQLTFTAHDTAIDYLIAQSSGALKLDGGGSIQTVAPRQIVYAGHVTASADLPEVVLAGLKELGKPAADGRLRVDWKARW